MLQDKEQDPLPSHRHGSASKTEVENYLDCLLVHHQHDNDQGNDSVEPAIVVKDLVDVPALSYDKDCSAAYRQRQKVEVLSFAADMACHLLYFGHQNPKLLRPTLEFRNFCVQVVAQFKTISPAVVLLALKYLARMVESLKNKNQRPKSEPGADSLMFTGALVLACNYLEEYHSNLTRPRIWARCTGFHKAEIESCRKMLMELLDYRLVITPAKYADWMAYLVDHTMKHMPKHQFVPLEHQSLAELAPINELYSTSDVGYIPPLLKTFTGDLICLTPSPPMQEAGSCKGFECDAAAVSSSHPQGQAQGQPRGEAETGLSAGHAGDFAAHMACCILYGHRGSVAAATTKDDIVEPRPSLRGFCRYIIDVAGLPHTVVLLALKYMQKLVWSLNSYHMYPEDDQKTEVQIFTGAVMAAQKYASEHDQILTNGAWACILGVPIRLVNFIERMLLEGIDYNLFTSADEYNLWFGYLTHLTETVMPSQHLALLSLRQPPSPPSRLCFFRVLLWHRSLLRLHPSLSLRVPTIRIQTVEVVSQSETRGDPAIFQRMQHHQLEEPEQK